MRILVRMPNWLGDAVMATPALGNLRNHHRGAQFTLVGSAAVAALFQGDPAFAAVIADPSKEHRLRPLGIANFARQLRREHGPFDLAVAFPNSVSSRWLLWLTGAKQRVGVRRDWRRMLLTDAISVDESAHQVEIYNQLVCGHLKTRDEAGPLSLHVPKRHVYPRPAIGINPGAAYGSAKRWDPLRFAAVAAALAETHDIVIFGSPIEAPMAGEIEHELAARGISRVENLAGRTSLGELTGRMAGLELLITNDSGPMHIAAALQVPTVAIFGPTRHLQTSQWRNPHSIIVRHDLPCAPCMHRTCPLGHHACMNDIQATEVLAAAQSLLARRKQAIA